MNKAVFIDQDGTIVKDVVYCSNPDDLDFLPTVLEGIKILNSMGLKLIIVTNQSGIAQVFSLKRRWPKFIKKCWRVSLTKAGKLMLFIIARTIQMKNVTVANQILECLNKLPKIGILILNHLFSLVISFLIWRRLIKPAAKPYLCLVKPPRPKRVKIKLDSMENWISLVQNL